MATEEYILNPNEIIIKLNYYNYYKIAQTVLKESFNRTRICTFIISISGPKCLSKLRP